MVHTPRFKFLHKIDSKYFLRLRQKMNRFFFISNQIRHPQHSAAFGSGRSWALLHSELPHHWDIWCYPFYRLVDKHLLLHQYYLKDEAKTTTRSRGVEEMTRCVLVAWTRIVLLCNLARCRKYSHRTRRHQRHCWCWPFSPGQKRSFYRHLSNASTISNTCDGGGWDRYEKSVEDGYILFAVPWKVHEK